MFAHGPGCSIPNQITLLIQKLERKIQEYDNPVAGKADSSRKTKLTKRKCKGEHINGQESNSEDSEYTGQDAGVAGTKKMDEDAEINVTGQSFCYWCWQRLPFMRISKNKIDLQFQFQYANQYPKAN
ncbi:hypothetical protein PGTUg99_015030 [Puccinia graminis f. sp. tritici]|uniref:Uncharacterized protein n=1 Tax=Puccinia graminis f. sp. tritici TaxID=56615 RepID=A0A5B0PFL6_PUCGR|nr:hypothetical protein PGTUg99_015030 [Puccinia graminis f. sp. tritici]